MENLKEGKVEVESKKEDGDLSIGNKIVMYSAIALAIYFSDSLSLPEFTQPKDRYSIEISERWVEMSKEYLDEQSNIATQMGSQKINFSGGYVLKTNKSTSTYPYILIQDREGDVKNYRTWKQSFKTEEESMTKALDEVAEKNSEIMSSPSVVDYFFDAAKHYVGINLDLNVSGEGTIRGRTVIILGRKQSTQISLYVKKEESEIYDADFMAMLNSFQFKPGYEYDENGANSGKPDPYRYLYAGIKGAAIGYIVSFLLMYFKKKSQKVEKLSANPTVIEQGLSEEK